MSSASPWASDRKPTRRPGRKAPTLRPDPNTSVTAGVRVVKLEISLIGNGWDTQNNYVSNQKVFVFFEYCKQLQKKNHFMNGGL